MNELGDSYKWWTEAKWWNGWTQLLTIGGTSKPFCADLVVNDKQLTIEIDTIAVGHLLQSRYFENSILNSTTISRHFEASGEPIPVLGGAKISVQYKG